jgi:hypothetical protein
MSALGRMPRCIRLTRLGDAVTGAEDGLAASWR